nr:unnamed protein product [Digitaria exilis]
MLETGGRPANSRTSHIRVLRCGMEKGKLEEMEEAAVEVDKGEPARAAGHSPDGPRGDAAPPPCCHSRAAVAVESPESVKNKLLASQREGRERAAAGRRRAG